MYHVIRLVRGGRSLRYAGVVVFIVAFAVIGVRLLLPSHAAGSLVGDLNNDGVVNIFDLSIFLNHWQQSGTGLYEDFNNDGVVNIFDLSILLSHWGQSSGGSGSIPVNNAEPYFTTSTVDANGTCTNGCAIVGQQLSITHGTWSNSPDSYSYQWMDCVTSAGTSTGVSVASGGSYIMTPPTTGSCTNASGPGATTATYTVGSNDVGKALAVNITATNNSGSTSTTTSGSCNTGLMTTTWNASTDPSKPTVSTYFDDGQPGCSPISAVVGTGQFGTGAAGEHFCTNAPVTCGFADIANTGPPAGTRLYAVPGDCTSPSGPNAGCSSTGSGWTYSGGDIHASSGAIIKNISTVQAGIIVNGVSNVTIEDSDLVKYGANEWIISLAGAASNITIQNNNIHGLDANTVGDGGDSAVRDVYCNATGVTISNNNIWFTAAALNNICATSGWNITGNYVHDFSYSSAGNHFDGIQFEGNGSSGGIAYFTNNTDLLDINQTLAVGMATDNSTINNNRQTIHNLVAGGDFPIYGGAGITYSTTNSVFAKNIFSSIYMGANSSGSGDASGSFGPTAQWGLGSTNTWTPNYWDDNGSAAAP